MNLLDAKSQTKETKEQLLTELHDLTEFSFKNQNGYDTKHVESMQKAICAISPLSVVDYFYARNNAFSWVNELKLYYFVIEKRRVHFYSSIFTMSVFVRWL